MENVESNDGTCPHAGPGGDAGLSRVRAAWANYVSAWRNLRDAVNAHPHVLRAYKTSFWGSHFAYFGGVAFHASDVYHIAGAACLVLMALGLLFSSDLE